MSDVNPTAECETCRKRADDFIELKATGAKLINLGRANCQECGARYTAFAEESEDD